jgi:hypothetical protein
LQEEAGGDLAWLPFRSFQISLPTMQASIHFLAGIAQEPYLLRDLIDALLEKNDFATGG